MYSYGQPVIFVRRQPMFVARNGLRMPPPLPFMMGHPHVRPPMMMFPQPPPLLSNHRRSRTPPRRNTTNSRSDRLRSNGTTTLFHQTDSGSADSILRSQKMRRGSSGLAGGGIYFASSSRHTDHKAKKHGVVLRCDVLLGRMKTISKHGDSSITFSSLQREGFDSVKIPRDNGTEFVVFNSDQVVSISRA